MLVDLSNGCCRSCSGLLEIVDIDDASMTVVCLECSDNYDVEPDAFEDGCMTYYLPLIAQRDGIDFTGE